MVTLVWRTDVHLADVSPQSRTDDWTQTIFSKLGQVGDIAKKVHANAVLDGGDFFHFKSPSRNSHELISKVAQVHSKYPCPVYGNIGNHDLKYGSLEFLPESPLAVLYESGVFKRLYDENEVTFTVPLAVPAFHEGPTPSLKVRVVGIPYHGTKYDRNRFTGIAKGDEDYLVVVVHCLASQAGGSMFEAEDIIGYQELVNLDPDVWCFGHWHKDQGVTEIAKGKWVVNVGSMSRGSISQDDLKRIPSCVVMRFSPENVTFEKIGLNVAPPEEVFNLEGRARAEARQTTMTAVVDRIKGKLNMREEGSVLDLVRDAATIPAPIRERTVYYLERAGAR